MNPSDVISGIAVIASLFALWRTEQTRKNLLRANWDDMREYRGKVRPIARHAYTQFIQDKSSEWPNNLEILLGSVQLPPNVPIRKNSQIRNWYEDNQRQLNADQRRMWEFANAVYPGGDVPSDPMEKSIIPNAEKASFDSSRRHFATFFHRQWEATSNRQLFSIVPHTLEDVILLSWLELALARATKDAGPQREGFGGKRGLFEYGKYLEKRHAR